MTTGWGDFNDSDLNGPGGFGSQTTPGTSDKKAAGARKNEDVIPVTTAMIHAMVPQSESLIIGSHVASKLTLCGIVRSVDQENMYVTYHVDDMTAKPVQVREWKDMESSAATDSLLKPDTQVRVFGYLRSFADQVYLNVLNITPLKDPTTDLKIHTLEVQYCQMYYEKDVYGKRLESSSSHAVNNRGDRGGSDYNNASAMDTSAPPPSTFNNTASMGGNVGPAATGLAPIQDKVYQCIRSNRDETGMSFDEIKKRFPQLAADQLTKVVNTLSNEGFVYTTIDDDHFKSTDAP